MNQNTYEKLQYEAFKAMVRSYCVSELGGQLIDKLTPSTNLDVVQLRLKETSEARAIIDTGSSVPFMGVTNLDHTMTKLDKGIVLTASELFTVAEFLRGCRRIASFMDKHAFIAPILAQYAQSMTDLRQIEEEIHFAIKNNQVDSEANRDLKRARHHIQTIEEKIKDRLNKFLTSASNKSYIQEFVVAYKNDHYTIPIKASYKNQVQGTVIEMSQKGTTVFVEPSVVSKLSAELDALRAEEAMLEYQILAGLTGLIVENTQLIRVNIELIAQYDMIFAKGKHSRHIDGIAPSTNDYGYINLVDAKHPLLTGSVVPLNFTIGDDYRSLVITGPNAGGKTIVLKTVGLVTLATMSGCHIAANPETEVAVFDQTFVDLGDNQSLENALSTFSSHMKNLSDILRVANNNTLLLFDEIGSGTEPNEGAALAIAILEAFYLKGTITVATTHYGEIKDFSDQHPDFMNAAMQFQNENLEPTYKLLMGQAGASNAMWISRKMAIPNHILQRAEGYLVDKNYQFDLVKNSKVRKAKADKPGDDLFTDYQKGDRVTLLETGQSALIYSQVDKYHQVTVYVAGEYVDIHIRRLQLNQKASDLYPDGYNLDNLFVDYATRKRNHDIERGSKKALRKIHKELRHKD